MLKKVKEKTGKNGVALADFLGVSEGTIYNWENKRSWPLWALEKCGILEGE